MKQILTNDKNNILDVTICDNQVKSIGCPGRKMKIQQAYYGREDGQTCPGGNIFYGACAIDVTFKIKQLCENKEACAVLSSKDQLNIQNDPCWRYTKKYLVIKKTCDNAGKVDFKLFL